jgi:hypothetical protein
MFNKKGEEGGGSAAVLVALIALMILVFLLFVPPSVREDILNDNTLDDWGYDSDDSDDDSDDDFTSMEKKGVLLLENPGEINEEGVASYSHPMPSLNLQLKTEGKELEAFGTVEVARSVFSEKLVNRPFYVEDLENTQNYVLSFNSVISEGELIIKLNGQEIFRGFVEGAVTPILLPKGLIDNANILEFDVTSPGWMFWATNDYALANVVIRADVTDVSNKRSSAVFYTDSIEKGDMVDGTLYFLPYCSENGQLTVKLNRAVVFNGIPRCGYVNKLEIAPQQILVGSNELEFEIDEGVYTIANIRFDSELKKRKAQLYYFDLDDEQYYNLTSRGYDAFLRLKFDNDYKNKEGRIYVNDNIRSFDTDEFMFKYKITNFVDEDYNSVRVVPEGSIDVTELRVWIEK